MKRGRDWRWLRLTVAHRAVTSFGWRWSQDPRRPGGQALISPRGRTFELRRAGGLMYVREYRDLACDSRLTRSKDTT